jgi:nucleotide-binding universal stress UspA family protein
VTDRWIVGVDGSPEARHALEWAARQARSHEARLEAVWTWHLPYSPALGLVGPSAGSLWSEVGDEVDEQLRELVAQVSRAEQVQIEPIAVQGHAAQTLLEASLGAGLLVVGNRGRGGFARLMLGSVSQQCATHARVPTAVVPAAAAIGQIGSVVVGVDGSDNSRCALLWAMRFAPAAADIRAIGAGEPWSFGLEGGYEVTARDLARQSEADFHRVIDEICAQAPESGRPLERVFEYDTARRVLLDAATDADLIVVGARGHGAVGAAILGSVSTFVLHRARVATVVVPRIDRPDSLPRDGS